VKNQNLPECITMANASTAMAWGDTPNSAMSDLSKSIPWCIDDYRGWQIFGLGMFIAKKRALMPGP
jgi:hypothetical protein